MEQKRLSVIWKWPVRCLKRKQQTEIHSQCTILEILLRMGLERIQVKKMQNSGLKKHLPDSLNWKRRKKRILTHTTESGKCMLKEKGRKKIMLWRRFGWTKQHPNTINTLSIHLQAYFIEDRE